jgi:glycosyltransferase involved in cell wall biosynthesis
MPPAPRRLAFVITELEPGGAERCLVELVTRLDRSRYAPEVYSLAPEPPAGKRVLLERLSDATIPVHCLGFGRATEYLQAVRTLTQRLSDQQPDLVQTFLFHANIVGCRAALAAKIPRIVTGIRVADPRKWRITLERFATARADRFVCVSQSVSEFYRRRGFASEQLVVIPNGVDLARWQTSAPADRKEFGFAANRRLLLYVGRLDRQKGLDGLFRQLGGLFDELPEHDLVLVGAGPDREALERQADTKKLRGRVHFLGWRDDVPALLAASDMLVLPSRWEGMPNVVLEAMAAGKPVVATQSEGTVELLGLTALEQTVAVGDWDGLAGFIKRIALDPALAQSLSEKNRRRAAQFSLDTMVERYVRLYETLLSAAK